MPDFIPSLEHRLYQFIQRADYQPMKQHELARALKIPADKRRDLRKVLQNLEDTGKIVCLRKNRWGLPDERHILTGTLSVHPDGFGFVTMEDPEKPDIFIPARNMGIGLHGDTVQVALSGSRRPARPGRGQKGAAPLATDQPTGRIERVIERRFDIMAGIYKVTPHYAYVIPDNPRILQNIRVRSVESVAKTARDEHRVVVKLLPWESPDNPLPGVVIEDLGPADAPGVEMISLMRSHGLEETFPDKIEKASRAIRSCRARDDEERRDLRDELLFTIDPEDARDFDDAVSLTRTSDQKWLLSVHIADVSAYVEPGSPIDKEARERGNSVYLVDRVIQMLPRHLTEEICSLNPNVERFAHTVRMTISTKGKVLDYETFPSLIRSSARLIYEQVQAFLHDGTRDGFPEVVGAMLKDMHQLSETLRRKRAREGSILFEMPEVRCVLDADGNPTDIVPRIAYTAYHLIEEFMLLANQTVARSIAEKGFPVAYRIHEPPDDEQWERIAVDLAALGIHEPSATREDLNAIAQSVAGEPVSHIVNLAMLRNLKRAVYSDERAEHFGLAFSHYLHFTSPIRRYADLIVHRVLKAIERGRPPPYSRDEMRDIALHCSQTEREAADAEQESVNMKRIDFYAAKLNAGDTGPYQALVTSMNARGLLVELVDTLQRGLVSFASMRKDHYLVNEDRNRAVGRRTRHAWKVGDLLDVELVRVDKVRKLVDFGVPEKAEEKPKPACRKKKKRRKD